MKKKQLDGYGSGTMENLILPDFSIQIGKWIIEQYDNKKETWCKSPEGKTFIIKLSTEDITHIPYYVLHKMNRWKLLELWRTYQKNLAISRLHTAIVVYQNFLANKQPIPEHQFISQIPLELPNFDKV